MAKPNSRATLQDYCLRQLGAPILEINVADEQVDDLMDDSLQFFYERHFDGVEKVLLKYQLTEEDKKKGRARGGGFSVGIASTSTASGVFEENESYLSEQHELIKTERELIDIEKKSEINLDVAKQELKDRKIKFDNFFKKKISSFDFKVFVFLIFFTFLFIFFLFDLFTF